MATHYCIEHHEGLSRSLEAAARKLIKLDWPTDLVVALEDGQTRELHGWERDELHHFIGESL